MKHVQRAEGLTLTSIQKSFGAYRALADVNLDVGEGQLVTLLGPSGSGKTTLLNIIAGFQYADAGIVSLAGADISHVAPAKRDIGMVFQNYALFPHMSVAENVAFPLEMRAIARAEIKTRVHEALTLVALENHADRLPRQLSGGQQQRVALARAFVFQPKLMLLDEPLGALDRKLREQIQLEIRRLQQRLGLTTVFVTHDQEEALILSDQIAVMNHGKIQQLGSPVDIYARPANRFVAEFIGESSLFDATPLAGNTARIGDSLTVVHGGEAQAWNALMVRPERVRPATDADGLANVFEGRVGEVVYLGESIRLRVDVSKDISFLARWQTRELPGVPAPGETMRIGFRSEDVQLLGEGS